MTNLKVQSEIGRLKTVLLHRPGKELENLTPKWLEQLLFDDIPWLDLAQQEHDQFAQLLRDHGVEVLYLTDLVAETLDSNPSVKEAFIQQFVLESQITSETLTDIITNHLRSISNTKELIELTMAGIKKTELPGFTKRSLTDHIRDYPFVTDPMPNLYFTRDPFAVIHHGVAIGKMYTKTRDRETIYGEFIFKHHPRYKDPSIACFYDRKQIPTLEGGDILVLNKEVIAIGVSERTHPAAIEKLAKNLFYQFPTSIQKILAFDIPKMRSSMHLDTIFTQVDDGVFLTHSSVNHEMDVFEVVRHPSLEGKLLITPLYKKLDEILEYYLNQKITLIPCGGEDSISSDREQWNDGANTLAIAPGEVIVYQRNHITNEILRQHGIKVYPIASSELSRGRGGPRCMSMPFIRES